MCKQQTTAVTVAGLCVLPASGCGITFLSLKAQTTSSSKHDGLPRRRRGRVTLDNHILTYLEYQGVAVVVSNVEVLLYVGGGWEGFRKKTAEVRT